MTVWGKLVTMAEARLEGTNIPSIAGVFDNCVRMDCSVSFFIV